MNKDMSRYHWGPSWRLLNILIYRRWPEAQVTMSPTVILKKVLPLTVLKLGHLFISHVFIECQLYNRYGSRHLGYLRE